jgi:hypothetical protein
MKKFAIFDLACVIKDELVRVKSPWWMLFRTKVFPKLNNPRVVFSLTIPPAQGSPIIIVILNVFLYYTTTYTITGAEDELVVGSAFALELDAARPYRAALKLAPGTAAVVSDA